METYAIGYDPYHQDFNVGDITIFKHSIMDGGEIVCQYISTPIKFRLPRKLKKKIKLVSGVLKIKKSQLSFHYEAYKMMQYYMCKKKWD